MPYPLSILGPAALACADPSWLSSQAATRILEMLSELPNIASSVGFEVRLGNDNPQVDLGISLHRSPLLLAAWHRFKSAQSEKGLTTETWSGFEEFLDRWCADDSDLYPWIPFIFLEIDADNDAFTPCIFTSFDWPITAHQDEAAERERSWKVADTALELLTRSAIPEGVRANVRDAFLKLPEGGRVVHSGAMLGRSLDQIRLSTAVPTGEFAPYLDALGLDGASYEQHIAQLDPATPTLHFECDIGDEPGPKIGVILAGRERIDGWLRRSSTASDDLGTQLTAVLEWGEREQHLPILASAGFAVANTISHFKIDTTPDPIGVKAYLSAHLTTAAGGSSA